MSAMKAIVHLIICVVSLGAGSAIINALAYRSPKIGQEPENMKIAEVLPSVLFHRDWLRQELLPAVRTQKILVIAKRPKLWNLNEGEIASDKIVFAHPVSPHLPRWIVDRAQALLV